MIHFSHRLRPSSHFLPLPMQYGRTSLDSVLLPILELPLSCPVYVVPARANYLGGDIISGLMDVDIQEKEGIQAFF